MKGEKEDPHEAQGWLQGKRAEVLVAFVLCLVVGAFEPAKVPAWLGVEGDLFSGLPQGRPGQEQRRGAWESYSLLKIFSSNLGKLKAQQRIGKRFPLLPSPSFSRFPIPLFSA